MILTVLHYVLILCAAGLSASGLVNGLGDEYGVALGTTGIALPALVCAIILWRAIRAPQEKVGVHWFLWVATLTLMLRSVFPAEELESLYSALLFLSVFLPALVRSEPVWVGAYIFTLFLYSGQMAVDARVWIEQTVPDYAVYTRMLQFAGAGFLGGLIPWLILKGRGDVREKEFRKTLEEMHAAAMAEAASKKPPQQQTAEMKTSAKKQQADQLSTAALAANTMVMESGSSTDTFTLLNVGGEEVNVQLKSMLFFMRYNFKALTAGAFIHNPAKNVLVLNCYESKTVEGIQVLDKAEIPLGSPGIGQLSGDPKIGVLMTGDMSIYRSSQSSYYAMGGDQVNSLIAAPIIFENSNKKEFLGVLAVDSVNKNAFSEHDKELMRRFSTIAAALIANIRMSVKLEHDARMFRTFYAASHGFSVALKMEDILNVLMNIVPQFIPACGRLVFVMYDSVKNCLRIHRVAGAAGELQEGMEFPLNAGLYSFAFIKNQAVSLPDFQAECGKYFRFVSGEPASPSTRTLFIMPIMGGEDRRCIGLFSLESSAPNLLNNDVSQLLTTVIENATVAITRSLLYLKMEKLATTDGLTGLNNHRTFQEIVARELERARRYGRPMSLLLTDIDHFKSFNDTYGHPVGDLVLREISACIRQAVRLNDFPARYGGEEFAVVLPETDEQGAYVIAERIRAAVEARVIDSGSDKLRVTISIGCVTFPTYGTTQQEIIDCSDKALYASKKGGRNRVTMYAPGMTVAE